MAHPKEIICPVDFSETSQKAARYAVDLAKGLGASVTLLHVYHVPAHTARVDAPRTVAELSEDLRQSIEDQFRALVRELKPEAVTVRTSLAVGVPYEQIVQAAQQAGADMVVIGATGQSKISRLLLGSVAERVVRASPLPVLVVPT